MANEIREDYMEEQVTTEALEYYAKKNNMTLQQAQAMIQGTATAKRIVIESYWENKLL